MSWEFYFSDIILSKYLVNSVSRVGNGLSDFGWKNNSFDTIFRKKLMIILYKLQKKMQKQSFSDIFWKDIGAFRTSSTLNKLLGFHSKMSEFAMECFCRSLKTSEWDSSLTKHYTKRHLLMSWPISIDTSLYLRLSKTPCMVMCTESR